MQVLKNEVKARIEKAALNEFEKVGFQKASMRNIAKEAGITVGNVYRYFQNKEELFYKLISPVFNEIVRIINENKQLNLDIENGYDLFIDHIVYSLIRINQQYRKELLILINGSEGTEYENAKEKIISLIEGKIRTEFFPQIIKHGGKIEDSFIARVLSVSNVEGLITILKHYDDEHSLKKAILQFHNFFFRYSVERFLDKKDR